MINKKQLDKEINNPTVKDFHGGSIQKFIKNQYHEWQDKYNRRAVFQEERPITTKAFIYERDLLIK